MAPLPYPRAVGAAVMILFVGFGATFATERAYDAGEVVEARIVGERLAGSRAFYAVEAEGARGEFAVTPLAGVCHGYPVVGTDTEVRRTTDGALRWNAWAARYPFTTGIGLLLLSTAGALGLRAVRG